MNKTLSCAVLPLLLAFLLPKALWAAEPQTMNVWPAKAPDEARPEKPESSATKGNVTRVTDVFTPTLTLYPAPKDKNTGASVIICPGGGYSILAWDLEGVEVAQWLNSIGVTAIILKYRVPEKRPEGDVNVTSICFRASAICFARACASGVGAGHGCHRRPLQFWFWLSATPVTGGLDPRLPHISFKRAYRTCGVLERPMSVSHKRRAEIFGVFFANFFWTVLLYSEWT